MSEPLTSSEIEDVLSSIRRLVSDDIRPAVRTVASANAGLNEPATVRAEDKLLLTPALRVVQSAPRKEDGWFAERVDPAVDEFEPEDYGLDAVVTRLGAQVPAFSDEWESETGDAVLTDTTASDPAETWEDFSANDAFEEDAFLAQPSETTDQRDVVQPEEILPYRQYEDEAELFAPENADDQIPGWAQSDFGDVAGDEARDDLADDDHSFEAKEVPFVSARSTAWADAAEASVIASLAMQDRPSRIHRAAAPEIVEDAPTELPYETAAPDAGELRFDEDILRELVRDLIREELQGKLGERMTRSMRKLVRVELLRLLATREFDE